MSTQLIIDGNAVYEIDEDCLACQKKGKSASLYRKNKNNIQAGKCSMQNNSAVDFSRSEMKNTRNLAESG